MIRWPERLSIQVEIFPLPATGTRRRNKSVPWNYTWKRLSQKPEIILSRPLCNSEYSLPDGSVILHNLGNKLTFLIGSKTPFLISPTGERINRLLPPWGKAGMGVFWSRDKLDLVIIVIKTNYYLYFEELHCQQTEVLQSVTKDLCDRLVLLSVNFSG